MHGSCPTQWKSHSRALVVAGLCWAMLGLSDRVEAAIVSFSSWTTWQTHWNENTTNTDDLIVTFPGAVPGTLTVANEAGGDPPLVGPSSLAIDDWAYWFSGGVGSAEQGSGGIFDSTSKVVVFGDNQNVFQTNLDDDPNLSGVVDVENAVFSGITLPAGSSGTLYVLGAARRGNTTEPLTFSVAGSDASGTA
ncbi:MAG: hypothetical protein GTO62_10740, partial [Planctomycetales bacterium]|nr:hypothetical protein [Planctomycetales bacterium]NIP69753.1 hypothetical protein [Planctomycetales bacterium]